jgi:hypothetical protein
MINKGDPINPKNLSDLVVSKFTTLLQNITGYIPLGFNDLYSLTGTKSFAIRPKVENPIYSTRTGSVLYDYLADKNQPDIGASFLGTPWNQVMFDNFSGSINFDFNLGSKDEPFVKHTSKLQLNPASDLRGGVPFRGNYPFLFNGFLGLSNSFEDKSIRLEIDTTGTSATVKAKQISLLNRAHDYSYENDSIPEESDRYNLETKTFKDINITFGTGGLAPNTDYIIALNYSSTSGSSIGIGTFSGQWTKTDKYPVISNEDIYSNKYRYTRPLFLIHTDSQSRFSVSNVDAWGEVETTLNSDKLYGKTYQQASSSNTTESIATSEVDRRVIPAWYYLDNDNNFIVSKTNYSGLIRHIPGAGASKVVIKRDTYGATLSEIDDQNIPVTIKVGSCEVTNGTNSIWLKDINVVMSQNTIKCNIAPYGASNSRGLYVWLVADPKSIGDNSRNTDTNLKVHLVFSPFPVWQNGLNGNLGVANALTQVGTSSAGTSKNLSNLEYRCRIGYIPPFKYSPFTAGTSEPFVSYDGDYYFPNLNYYSTIANQYNVLGTGVTPAGAWTPIAGTSVYSIPQYGIVGTSNTDNHGTSYTCKTLNLDFINSSGTKVATDGTKSQYVGVTGNLITSQDIYSKLDIYNYNGKKTTLVQNITIPVYSNDTLSYSGTGADGGTYWTGRYKSAWIRGFTLPIDYK